MAFHVGKFVVVGGFQSVTNDAGALVGYRGTWAVVDNDKAEDLVSHVIAEGALPNTFRGAPEAQHNGELEAIQQARKLQNNATLTAERYPRGAMGID